MYLSKNQTGYALAGLLAALLAGPAAGLQDDGAATPARRGSDQCATCHASQAEERLSAPTHNLEYDFHARVGIGCAECHGGDPTAPEVQQGHDKEKGFIGIPPAEAIPDLCGRCHADPAYMRTENPSLPVDQLEKYWTSRHGELLRMGLRKVAHCASCHTAHNIRPANDPSSSVYPVTLPRTCAHCHADPEYMAGFSIPTDQFSKYAASVHGKALLEREDIGAPACNDCHGNHGAMPPGAESLSHVCGLCHSINAELFDQSPHAEAFAQKEMAQCAVCHNYHAIAEPQHSDLGMGAKTVCIDCHYEGDRGWVGGQKIESLIDEVVQARVDAETLLDQAQILGMDIEDGRFLLQDYRKNYLQLRTLSHSLNMDTIGEKAAEALGQANEAKGIAEAAIGEYHYRRRGLMVSLLFSLPVILLLWVKIRQLGPR